MNTNIKRLAISHIISRLYKSWQITQWVNGRTVSKLIDTKANS